ncbi:MAG: ABC transporter permease, partial [Gemmatimonadota bacterium]
MRMRWRRPRFVDRLLGRDPAGEVDEELRHHLEQRVRDYMVRGMGPEEARRAALERLGDLDAVKRECVGLLAAERRTEERRSRFRVSWLDVKLGLRMLRKYPGLSTASVVGMAVAVAVGASAFGSVWALLRSELPLPGGDRLVAVWLEDAREYGTPWRQVANDFLLWKDELRLVGDLAASRPFANPYRTLIMPDGSADRVRIAAMTASGFRAARVEPVLGRTLLSEDELEGAPPVVVIAWEEWQRRFGGSPDAVGRTLRLGATTHTVVGVMPEGFRFPFNDRFWVPLRLEGGEHAWGEGPSIVVFGRLADGATLEQARAEFANLVRRTAATHPETHARLRPRLATYTESFVDFDDPVSAWAMRSLPLAVALLLVLVSANVAMLVYARTATRLGEIAVRSALGASRRRIVLQLFVEAFVLSAVASAVGLAVAAAGLSEVQRFLDRAARDQMPFWLDFGLSPGMAAYVAGLAVLAAVVVGVLPGLRVTGRAVHEGLQRFASGAGRMRLGRTWTALVVGQVTLAVGVLPVCVDVASRAVLRGAAETGYPAEEVLVGRLRLEPDEPPAGGEAGDAEGRAGSAAAARNGEAGAGEPRAGAGATAGESALPAPFAERTAELVRRFQAEPGVRAVALASSFRGGVDAWVEIDGVGRQRVRFDRVEPGFFDVIGAPVLGGRGFRRSDLEEGSTAAIVDRRFVDEVLEGGPALGRRLRGVAPPSGGEGEWAAGPWLEIVGVVPVLHPPSAFDRAPPKLFRPLALGRQTGVALVTRIEPGTAPALAGRLRAAAAAVDPALQLDDVSTAAAEERSIRTLARFVGLATVLVTLAVVLLSAAGVSAMMSFAVARRH